MMHLVAPIVAIGATMIVRKVMNSGYRRVTGTRAPDAHDAGVTFTRALVWAVATAATAAAVPVPNLPQWAAAKPLLATAWRESTAGPDAVKARRAFTTAQEQLQAAVPTPAQGD